MAASNPFYDSAGAAPAAGVSTDLYTVPTGYRAILSVFFCNRGAATTIRCVIAPNGAATANSQYIYYDTTLPANDTLAEKRICLTQGTVLRGQAASADVSINVIVEELHQLANV